MSQFFKILAPEVLVLLWIVSGQALAHEMSSPNFKIQRDSINVGGFRGTSNTYILEQTVGQFVSERLMGSNFIIRSGFQQTFSKPSIPLPPEPEGGGGGGLLGAVGADPFPPTIENIAIDFTPEGQIVIIFETDELTTAEFYFGLEKLEKIASQEQPATKHQIKLEGVLPGLTYRFEIRVKDLKGQETSSGEKTFKVEPLPDFLPPANVRDFEAVPGDSQVELRWQNPIDKDFAGVRLVRSTVFYPQSPEDGQIIFEGIAELFLDTGLINGQRYYYTIFSYDRARNYSSGVTISATPRILVPEEVVLPEIPQEIIPKAPPEEIPADIQKLKLEDFDFIQDSGLRYPVDGVITIEPTKPLLILLDYDKVPEVLKTILVTLRQKDGKVFSFLLKIDSNKENYGAKILPPEPGLYDINFTILDFKNQSTKEIKAKLKVKEESGNVQSEDRETFLIKVFQVIQNFIKNFKIMLGSIIDALVEVVKKILD